MTYSGKSQEFYQQQAATLRSKFTDKRIRMSVREIGEALGYKGKSTGATMNAINHLIVIGAVEYDEEKKAYYLT